MLLVFHSLPFLFRTPTTSKRRTRPPSGDGRRRSLPLSQHPLTTGANSPTVANHPSPKLPNSTSAFSALGSGGRTTTTRNRNDAFETSHSPAHVKRATQRSMSCGSQPGQVKLFGENAGADEALSAAADDSALLSHSTPSPKSRDPTKGRDMGLNPGFLSRSSSSDTPKQTVLQTNETSPSSSALYSLSAGLFAQRRQNQLLDSPTTLHYSPLISSDRRRAPEATDTDSEHTQLAAEAAAVALLSHGRGENLVKRSFTSSNCATSDSIDCKNSYPAEPSALLARSGVALPEQQLQQRAFQSVTSFQSPVHSRQASAISEGNSSLEAVDAHRGEVERDLLQRAVEDHNQRRQLDIFKISLRPDETEEVRRHDCVFS